MKLKTRKKRQEGNTERGKTAAVLAAREENPVRRRKK